MNRHDALLSMRKTTLALAAAAALLAALGAGAVALYAGAAAAAVLLAAAAALATLAHAGRRVQERQRRLEAGEPDLFLRSNDARSEAAVRGGAVPPAGALRRWAARRLFGHRVLVGDSVEVRSLEEIRRTLDAGGCLDGLPFMDEMAAYCGQHARVFRVVDKIYDYGRSKGMRRLDDSVLLVGLRCNGTAHAGCQAACYLIWKAAWLKPVAAAGATAPAAPATVAAPGAPVSDDPAPVYSCQYTQLTTASRPLNTAHPAAWLGPWIAGNVTGASLRIALLTRLFNAVQGWRRGATYPSRPVLDYDKSLQGEPLKAGDWVRVKLPAEIARTLDRNSKNRGLWFDGDMLKHCGQAYPVRGRVDRIIDIRTGAMATMKTPCIVLESVDFSGESQVFGEQHDYLYWREAWLTRIPAPERVAA